jgi:predicted dithiol-disulfide oxidoreductase (DUF899 family)
MTVPTFVVSQQEWNARREALSSIWALLDITPFGRQEEWQDAPEGVPQDRTGSWTRRHDEYTQEQLAGGRTRL